MSTELYRTGLLHKGVQYLELIRFSHTIFAMPFAILASILALKVPLAGDVLVQLRLRDGIGLVLCMVFARSAAMAFNRLVDRDIDAQNPRTQDRHLPAGKLSLREVRLLTVGCSVSFILSTALFLPNWIPLAASVPVLLWLLGYSYAKRFTSGAHFWLGISLALAPLCAWLALRGPFSLQVPADLLAPLLLSSAVALWVTGFDIIYACQDAQFDQQAGLNSIPARLGVARALRFSAILHGAMVLALFFLPWADTHLGLGGLYYAALACVSLLLAYQHYLVRPDDLRRVGVAFFQVNAVISLVLMSCAAIDAWLT